MSGYSHVVADTGSLSSGLHEDNEQEQPMIEDVADDEKTIESHQKTTSTEDNGEQASLENADNYNLYNFSDDELDEMGEILTESREKTKKEQSEERLREQRKDKRYLLSEAIAEDMDLSIKEHLQIEKRFLNAERSEYSPKYKQLAGEIFTAGIFGGLAFMVVYFALSKKCSVPAGFMVFAGATGYFVYNFDLKRRSFPAFHYLNLLDKLESAEKTLQGHIGFIIKRTMLTFPLVRVAEFRELDEIHNTDFVSSRYHFNSTTLKAMMPIMEEGEQKYISLLEKMGSKKDSFEKLFLIYGILREVYNEVDQEKMTPEEKKELKNLHESFNLAANEMIKYFSTIYRWALKNKDQNEGIFDNIQLNVGIVGQVLEYCKNELNAFVEEKEATNPLDQTASTIDVPLTDSD